MTTRQFAGVWFVVAVIFLLSIRVAFQVGLTEGSHTAFAVCKTRTDVDTVFVTTRLPWPKDSVVNPVFPR